jgi:hypothetical protein
MRLSYKELIDKKICVACRYEQAREGKTLCQKCADKQRSRDSLRKKVKNNIKCYGCGKMLYSQSDKFIGMYGEKIKIVCAECLDFCLNHKCDNCHNVTYSGFIEDCALHK